MIRKRTIRSLVPVTAVAFNLAATMYGATIPSLSVNATAERHAISPYIYGIANGLDATFADEIKLPNTRWGGDAASRYNWEQDSSNSGGDWYFTGGSGTSNPKAGASVDDMINTYKPAGTRSLVTIPIIPYVNKTSEYNCSYPTNRYGAQSGTNPYIHPNGEDCGTGYTTKNVAIKDTDISANNIANTTSLQKSWVEHLVAEHGTTAKGGVGFYQLDNEPGGWDNTHRDIVPTAATYNTIISLGEQYATAIKQADPSALVMGPSDFTLGGWVGTTSQQGGLLAGEYYLQKLAAYDKAQGKRHLDYFDEHYYPVFTNPTNQLASTRTLWDPTYNGGTWVEQYVFGDGMQLIPRFQSWIAKYYPGTKLSFSEYSIDSGNKLVTDALAEADVLGIFGRQSVDFADMWVTPAPTDPIAYAFRLYRNYDGNGNQFGQTSVESNSSNQAELSIYGAQRSSDGALTMVVINKTTAAIDTKLTLSNFKGATSAALYNYSKSNLKEIKNLGQVSIKSNVLSYTYPAYSATVIVVAEAK